MTLTPSPTELSTAATDLVLAILALTILITINNTQSTDTLKKCYWSAMFACLTGASLLGTATHGLPLEAGTIKLLWHPLNLLLGSVITFFVLGAAHELSGKTLSRKLTPWLLFALMLFLILATIFPDSFLVFILYEGAGMLFALGVYLYLSVQHKQPSAYWMAAGITVTILAAIMQATNISMTIIWSFDHNGVFHLIQIPGILLIFRSIQLSLSE